MKKLLVISLFALFSVQLHALSDAALFNAYYKTAKNDARVESLTHKIKSSAEKTIIYGIAICVIFYLYESSGCKKIPYAFTFGFFEGVAYTLFLKSFFDTIRSEKEREKVLFDIAQQLKIAYEREQKSLSFIIAKPSHTLS